MAKKDKNWKKFGSPYDPAHSGKMQLPPEKRGEFFKELEAKKEK